MIADVIEQLVRFFWSDAEIEREHLLTKMVCTVERFQPGSVIQRHLPAIGAPLQAFQNPGIGYAIDADTNYSTESGESAPSFPPMFRNLPQRTHAPPTEPNFDKFHPPKFTSAVAETLLPIPPPPASTPPPETERRAKPVYDVNSWGCYSDRDRIPQKHSISAANTYEAIESSAFSREAKRDWSSHSWSTNSSWHRGDQTQSWHDHSGTHDHSWTSRSSPADKPQSWHEESWTSRSSHADQPHSWDYHSWTSRSSPAVEPQSWHEGSWYSRQSPSSSSSFNPESFVQVIMQAFAAYSASLPQNRSSGL